MAKKLPQDCTKRELAETIALRARMFCRTAIANADGSKASVPVTRLALEEARSAIMRSLRYRSLGDAGMPSLRTIVAACRRQHDPELDMLRLEVGA